MDKQHSKNIKNQMPNIDIYQDYKKLKKKKVLTIWAFLFLLFMLVVININIGSTQQNIFDLLSGIIEKNQSALIVLINLRLPHVLCAIISGAALGVCGCILQSSLSNPLSSPSAIGVSQGASCGACIAIIGISEILSDYKIITTIIFAFGFALIPTLIIFFISKLKRISPVSIILTGVAMSIFFSGITAIVQYFADSSKIAEVVYWTFGSLYNANYSNLPIMAFITIVTILYSIINYVNYNALECGELCAHSIGINVNSTRIINLIIAAVCAACITAFCGTINFIGLISPHICRKFIGSNYKYLIPASSICGACILTIGDIISAIIIPGCILPIGAITSLFGAPIFIYVLIKKKVN